MVENVELLQQQRNHLLRGLRTENTNVSNERCYVQFDINIPRQICAPFKCNDTCCIIRNNMFLVVKYNEHDWFELIAEQMYTIT